MSNIDKCIKLLDKNIQDTKKLLNTLKNLDTTKENSSSIACLDCKLVQADYDVVHREYIYSCKKARKSIEQIEKTPKWCPLLEE